MRQEERHDRRVAETVRRERAAGIVRVRVRIEVARQHADGGTVVDRKVDRMDRGFACERSQRHQQCYEKREEDVPWRQEGEALALQQVLGEEPVHRHRGHRQ